VMKAMLLTPMRGVTLQRYTVWTYYMLRSGMSLIAFALPIVLLIGGNRTAPDPQPTSISGYYHTAMRDVFVGALITLGTFLILYRVYNRLENWLLNVAGLAVIGVGLCPCDRDPGSTDGAAHIFMLAPVHGICAAVAFGCLAVVAIFLGRDTVPQLPQRARARYTTIYIVLGVAMVTAPVTTMILAHRSATSLFWVESAALWVFALYWTVKTMEYRATQADITALSGKF